MKETRRDESVGACDNPQEPTRRSFLVASLKGACAMTSGAALASLLASCGSDRGPTAIVGDTLIQIDITLAQFSALSTAGGLVALNGGDVSGLPANGVFIWRESANSVIVLDRTCTHEQCQVGTFIGPTATCPCHGSQYDIDGNAVSGPAVFALTRYAATITGTVIEFKV